MFKQPIPLSAETHRDLRFSPDQPFDFARELVFIPLTAAELFKVARETVIVFPIQRGVPQALVAFEAGCNVYIDDAGHWMGRYVPAHLRRYPFVLGEIPTTPEEREENGRRFGLQVDAGAPHLNKPDGIRLFAVGLGRQGELDIPELEAMASDPTDFRHAPDGEDLTAIYRAIAVEIPCPAIRHWGSR